MAATVSLLLSTLLVLTLSLVSHAVSLRTLKETALRLEHEQWMARHARNYTDLAEKEKRFKIFKATKKHIEKFNLAAENRSYTLGLNQFADMTNEEFYTYSTGYMPSPYGYASTPFRYEGATNVPLSIDWREKGAVTPIKSQGYCGSCWAFSAIASIESLIYKTTGQLISLSEQQLVDCNVDSLDRGCHGGWMEDAFNYIIQNNGISSEANYPYMAYQEYCNPQAAPTIRITGYEEVPPNDEDALLKAVANQPVSAVVDADSDYFKYYRGGIFEGYCGNFPNHAITIVGYGESDGVKYWLIKNSWGDEWWGEGGYMRLRRGVNGPQGLCGINQRPVYPV